MKGKTYIMGTRHLIEVIDEYGDLKVSQYGQWDGYPSSAGIEILNFLKKTNLEDFKTRLLSCEFLTEEELEKLDELQMPVPYHRSRDRGSEILDIIVKNADTLQLKNSHTFGYNSLFCEWAYLIDLKTNTFRIFEGFNINILDKGETFYKETADYENYFGVKLKKVYNLDNLPDEDSFLSDLNPDEDEDK